MKDDYDKPNIGDKVQFLAVECEISVEEVPTRQPLLQDGIVIVGDQYGEMHFCECEGKGWVIVRPDMLTPKQMDLL